jgi:hypothetical protein
MAAAEDWRFKQNTKKSPVTRIRFPEETAGPRAFQNMVPAVGN